MFLECQQLIPVDNDEGIIHIPAQNFGLWCWKTSDSNRCRTASAMDPEIGEPSVPPEGGKGASGASPVAASAMPAATTTAAPATTATPSACQWCFRLLFSMFLICSVHPCAVHRGTQNDGGEKKEIELRLHHELTNCIPKASR
ncbi:hypothetical protein SprV_0602068900 [Sparganum proliferum]